MSFRNIINKLLNKGVIKEKIHHDIISEWIIGGKRMPPPHLIKQLAIKNEKDVSGYNILVETGTYLGDMVEVQKHVFKKVYSIELGVELYSNAVQKFEADKNVFILQGDSGEVLKDLMPKILEPAIFWLDGHYSGGITARGEKECPIFEELESIIMAKELSHIILIDDARLFNGSNDYPNVEELKAFLIKWDQKFNLSIDNDIIRIAL